MFLKGGKNLSVQASLKKCESSFTNTFFDPGVGLGVEEDKALPQRNTNWVLMRSSASVSEEPM